MTDEERDEMEKLMLSLDEWSKRSGIYYTLSNRGDAASEMGSYGVRDQSHARIPTFDGDCDLHDETPFWHYVLIVAFLFSALLLVVSLVTDPSTDVPDEPATYDERNNPWRDEP